MGIAITGKKRLEILAKQDKIGKDDAHLKD
jgi:hypothetical protein